MKRTIVTCDDCGEDIPDCKKYWSLDCSPVGVPTTESRKYLDLCFSCFDRILLSPALAELKDTTHER